MEHDMTTGKHIIWAIIDSDRIDPSTASYYRYSAVQKFLESHPLMHDWKQAHRDGFRAVKLQEVEN